MLSLGYHSTSLLTPFISRMFSAIRFAKTHEWMKLEGDVATVGISNHAQKELGDIVFIEVPKANKPIAKGGILTTIETVKTVASVYSPVSGTIIEGNEKLTKNQQILNKDPKGEGWIAKIKVDEDEAKEIFNSLLTKEQYRKLL